MNTTIVVEGRTDEVIARRLIEHLRAKAKIVVGNGASAAVSRARSILATDATERVALVVDADSSDESAIEERERSLSAVLAMVAPPARWHLGLLTPNLELVLLKSPVVARALLKRDLTEKDITSAEAARKALLLNRPESLRRVRELSSSALDDLLKVSREFNALAEFVKARPLSSAA